MSNYPLPLERLIGYFSRFPGVGKRSAERMALSALSWTSEELSDFGDVLSSLREAVKACAVCGNICEGDLCPVCLDSGRNRELVCVVEHASQIIQFERSGSYHGLYHVLGGKLSPLSGKGPDDLRLAELRDRLESGGIRELILATSPDVEGEATAHFLAREFSSYSVKITRIASGVPIGSDLSYADSATLAIALEGRRGLEQ